jgi:hypothetical protein
VNILLAIAALTGLPRLRMRLRRVLGPALFVAAGLEVLKTVGRLYVQRTEANPAYQVVTGAVAVLVFLSLLNQFILFRRRAHRHQHPRTRHRPRRHTATRRATPRPIGRHSRPPPRDPAPQADPPQGRQRIRRAPAPPAAVAVTWRRADQRYAGWQVPGRGRATLGWVTNMDLHCVVTELLDQPHR